jgi:uncharacterized protein (TIGR00162 family)
MVCIVSIRERPKLDDPVLIEGLPGIGFVASIAALHLIRELEANPFAEIRCSSFQDFAVTAEDGKTKSPMCELYHCKRSKGENDLIILHGNTQALTTTGQYELCGTILDVYQELGGNLVITLGGFKREQQVEHPKLYFAATDKEMASQLLDLGAEVIQGQIFGVAGLLIGIGKLRGYRGFCLLAETLGLYPDEIATREVLKALCKKLNLNIRLDNLEDTAKLARNLLENFGLLDHAKKGKMKETSQLRWVV